MLFPQEGVVETQSVSSVNGVQLIDLNPNPSLSSAAILKLPLDLVNFVCENNFQQLQANAPRDDSGPSRRENGRKMLRFFNASLDHLDLTPDKELMAKEPTRLRRGSSF